MRIRTTTKKNIIVFLAIFIIGLAFGAFCNNFIKGKLITTGIAEDLRLDDQEATIRAIQKVMPAVVSIIVYDYEEYITIDLKTGSRSVEKEKTQKGSGTGFLISSDGLILTNKHVVSAGKEKTSEYRVILNSDPSGLGYAGKQYYAQLIGKDPLKDLAVLKIFDKDLPYVELSNSDNLQVGTTVIAIGNALGRYQNSVTKGIVSGLARSIIASDQAGNAEALDNVIQTDAEINFGNSGGPLIDLSGAVVGINVAIDQQGSAINFAIPINDARPVIKSVREIGRIVRPRLGVLYLMITPELAQDMELSRDSGALILRGEDGGAAVLSDSPADKGGLAEGDIIFEINAIEIKNRNTLFSVIQKYKPRDRIGLKIQRGDKVIIRVVELDEF
ncbi:MAG: trypsin-like peptidase domain-containing protein [Patescibacteria group bacterium]|nr:trypsin-like peptidase domain-containing protein [Patescibacteria group bacterium]